MKSICLYWKCENPQEGEGHYCKEHAYVKNPYQVASVIEAANNKLRTAWKGMDEYFKQTKRSEKRK